MKELITQFGESAGKIWSALNVKGPLSKEEIKEITQLEEFELNAGIGWLARENKISLESDNRYKLSQTNMTKQVGTTAGRIWRILDIWDEADITTMERLGDIEESDIHTALGWLAREDKIRLNEKQKFNLK